MTKFSFEVPIPHLDHFDPYQDYLFMLSFLFKEKEYLEYYNRKKGKRITIIDNSYNELLKPNTVQEMTLMFQLYDPNLVVSPDCDIWTLDQSLNTFKELSIHVPKYRILPIARSSQEIEELKKLKVLYHAIPYENRLSMGPEALTKGPVHFLGLNNLQEILTFKPYSCDTGMPIKLACRGISILKWLASGCPHIQTFPEYFSKTLTREQLELAYKNIRDLKELVEKGGM